MVCGTEPCGQTLCPVYCDTPVYCDVCSTYNTTVEQYQSNDTIVVAVNKTVLVDQNVTSLQCANQPVYQDQVLTRYVVKNGNCAANVYVTSYVLITRCTDRLSIL